VLVGGLVGGGVAGLVVFRAVWDALYVSGNNHGDVLPWFVPLLAIPPAFVAICAVAGCVAAVSPVALLVLAPWRDRGAAPRREPVDGLAALGLGDD
jgi:uncharacterized membrane protein